jgi:hypothetical protein
MLESFFEVDVALGNDPGSQDLAAMTPKRSELTEDNSHACSVFMERDTQLKEILVKTRYLLLNI